MPHCSYHITSGFLAMFVNSIRQDSAGISASPSRPRTGADDCLGRLFFPRIICCALWQRFLSIVDSLPRGAIVN